MGLASGLHCALDSPPSIGAMCPIESMSRLGSGGHMSLGAQREQDSWDPMSESVASASLGQGRKGGAITPAEETSAAAGVAL